MSDTVRLKAVFHVEWEYDADPDDYGTNVPNEMAKIDLENFKSDPLMYLPIHDEDEGASVSITVDPA